MELKIDLESKEENVVSIIGTAYMWLRDVMKDEPTEVRVSRATEVGFVRVVFHLKEERFVSGFISIPAAVLNFDQSREYFLEHIAKQYVLNAEVKNDK